MTVTAPKEIFISLVVPAYNEEEVIDSFYARTRATLEKISDRYEIIFVNDGSKDRTADKIVAIHNRDSRVKLIDLSRNFGKEIAMTAGLDFSKAEITVVIDADLQDPPELIPQMIQKWRDGYDTVYATRTARDGETFFKKITASAFYRVISTLTRVEIPANTGDFRLMSRRTVDALILLREQHRFMKGVYSWVGFNQTGIPYQRDPRMSGRTKWDYWKLWNFALEGITSFSYVPLQFASYAGIGVAFLSFLYAAYLVVRTLIYGIDAPGYASIMVAILFFSGVQLIFLGIIGEYLGRISTEAKMRPLYLVQNVMGFGSIEGQYIFHENKKNYESCQGNLR